MFNKRFYRFVSYFATAVLFTAVGYYLPHNGIPQNSTVQNHLNPLAQCFPASNETPQVALDKKIKRSEPQLSTYKKSALKYTIENSDNNELTDTLSALFPNANVIENIDDIRLFANRLMSEINSSDQVVHEDSEASISFSLSNTASTDIRHSFSVSKKQKIYAHINVNSGLGRNQAKFFVKWRNVDTNEILLFSPKSINPHSDSNWVSFVPEASWGDHNYEVIFYQFNSQLQKLASETYTTYIEE